MTLFRSSVRLMAAAMVLGVGGIAATPAFAADAQSRGAATALRLGIAGNPVDSGPYVATNDGGGESTTGNNAPAVQVLGKQNVVNQGTLHQDASTSVSGRELSAAACAGLSGDGATLVDIGDTSCLQQGQDTASLNAGTLNLSDLDLAGAVVDNGGLSDALVAALGPVLGPLLDGSDALTGPLDDALDDVLGALGDPALTLDAGLVQARCTASPGSANGSSDLADAAVAVDFGDQAQAAGVDPVQIALPSDPAPNTRVVTDLDAVTREITDGLRASLRDNADNGALGGVFTTLGLSAPQITTTINAVVGQVSTQLQPVEDNVLDITLNKQTRAGDSQISVTALDAQVLPDAPDVFEASLASLQIGDISCLGATATRDNGGDDGGGNGGGNGGGDGGGNGGPGTGNPGGGSSTVPTSIDSGLASAPTSGSSIPGGVLAALGGLCLIAAAGTAARWLLVRGR